MSIPAILFLISNFFLGIVLVNYFLAALSRFTKFASSFFIGIYFSSTFIFILSYIFRSSQDSILHAIIYLVVLEILLFIFLLRKKREIFDIKISLFEISLMVILFCFSWYIMQKSFGYQDGNIMIASNLYIDMGAHVPLIRSFSEGSNIPPEFPYFSNVPLIYHFFYDFTVALYEKLGMRIDVVFNLLSALSLTGLLALLFSFSQEMFGEKRLVGLIAIALFLFNSSFSFFYTIIKYLGPEFLYKTYHHNVYLGNGPFGENIVSIFWNLNTYLNQRQLIFGLGILLIILSIIYKYFTTYNNFSWIFLGFIVGILPFWHTNIFISIETISIIAAFILFLQKKSWKPLAAFIILSIFIALPQILVIKHFQSIQFQFLTPGFIVKNLNVTNFITYWIFNLGLSIITIIAGVVAANKNNKLFFIGILLLFIMPNLFQFSPQIFDNHKFLNSFILLANMYSAYFLYLLFKKKLLYKFIAFFFLLLLTLSGMIDFLVVKNDIKAPILDYPNSKFLTWVKANTDQRDIFLTNTEIYDPINLVGRHSFVGRSHYLWAYGLNPEERLKLKNSYFLSMNDSDLSILKTNGVKYVVFYAPPLASLKKIVNSPNSRVKIVYKDENVIVLRVI